MSATEMSTKTVTEAPAVTLAGVSKVYGRGPSAVQALDQVSLSVAPGEFTCLIGASGCGKSTMLSLVAGLDKPTEGNIAVAGRIAMMFQEPALFPWLSEGTKHCPPPSQAMYTQPAWGSNSPSLAAPFARNS